MKKKNWIKYAICGIPAGLINGLFGASGGIILVLLYQKLFGMEEKEALSTSLMVMPALSAVSVVYLWGSLTLPGGKMMVLCAGGIAGGILGATIFKRLSHRLMRRIFALFILWAAYRAFFG